MPEVEQFWCERRRSWLKRDSCAAQWKRANPGRKLRTGTDAMSHSAAGYTACAGCEVGQVHDRGGVAPGLETRVVDLERLAARGGERTSELGTVMAFTDDAAAKLGIPKGERVPAVITRTGLPKQSPPARPAERQEETMAAKTCATCGEAFEGHPRSKYCSDDCRPSKNHAVRKTQGKAKRRSAAKKTNGAPEPKKRRASRPTPASNGDAARAQELLELAGFEVTAVQIPAGVALVIGGGA